MIANCVEVFNIIAGFLRYRELHIFKDAAAIIKNSITADIYDKAYMLSAANFKERNKHVFCRHNAICSIVKTAVTKNNYEIQPRVLYSERPLIIAASSLF